MNATTTGSTALRRVLRGADVFALAFGAMIGWGWVVLAGDMIDTAGSLGSALAFVIGAAMVLLVGLTYAELTPALSRAGGELAFTYVGLGPRASYAAGWTSALAYVSVCAFEAVALPTVAQYLFGALAGAHLWTVAGWDVTAGWAATGVIGALAIGAVNHFGIRASSTMQLAGAALMLLIGLALFVPGAFAGDPANLNPYFTTTSGLFAVVMMTPFLFLGFDVVPQVAEEIDVPGRSIGRLIVVSIVIALVWYVAVQLVVGYTLTPAQHSAADLPTADAMVAVWRSPWAGRVLVLAGLLGIVTSWNACFLGATRLLFAMARAGMLPAVFARVHPRYGTPTGTIVLLTVLTMIAPFFGRAALVWLVNAGGLAAVVSFLCVAVSFLAIRRRHPALPRPYRVPAGGVVGVLAVIATLGFVVLYLPGGPSALAWPYEWGIVLVWVGAGALLALDMERRVRRLGRGEQARRMLGDHAEKLGYAGPPTLTRPQQSDTLGA